MEIERYTELLNTLRRWRDIFAENLRIQIENSSNLNTKAHNLHRGEGVGENYGTWLDRFCRQLAIQFILKTLFIRVLEDRGLLKPNRIRTRDSQQLFQSLTSYLGTTAYLRFVFRDIAYILPDLFAETNQDIVWPDDALSEQFIEDVWRRADVDRDGWLRYDFRGEGDKGFDSRFIGDIYQDIDEEAREHYALLQTPHFISQFILDHTLEKRFEEKDFREVTLIDPTCGSGHFLVDAFKRFVDRYTEVGEYVDSSVGKAKLACNIIERHLFGADLNPYACALSRFRLMLAACDFAHPIDLEAFREQYFNIVHCDSLIKYEDEERISISQRMDQSIEDVKAEYQTLYGTKETIHSARKLFSRKYDVVVGNPPYITAKDPIKREIYRDTYDSAYRKFGLAAPFIERFIKLAVQSESGGHIGAIVTNAFATRLYGKKLIENVLPNCDLNAILDLSGVHIPGHGTPTLILFARNQQQLNDKVLVVSNIKGEPEIPRNPARGKAWISVVTGYIQGHGYRDEYVDVFERPLSTMQKHPWLFGGPKTRLYERILRSSYPIEEDIAYPIGFGAILGRDEIFIHSKDLVRRFDFKTQRLKPLVLGKEIRDWSLNNQNYAIFPYQEPDYGLIELNPEDSEYRFLVPYKEILENRPTFGGNFQTSGKRFFEYHQFPVVKAKSPGFICYAFVSTHNHFVFIKEWRIFKQSSPIIKLSYSSLDKWYVVLGLLNSCINCFILKQLCFDKRAGKDPVRDTYYEFSGTNVSHSLIPLGLNNQTTNFQRLSNLSMDITNISDMFPSLRASKIFEKDGESYFEYYKQLDDYSETHLSLRNAISDNNFIDAQNIIIRLRSSYRKRLIFLQEEIDWLAYEMHGMIPHAPMAVDYLSHEEYEFGELELGQRAFEQAGKGYKGDWPESWHDGAQGYFPGPAARLPKLSENIQRLIRDRMDIIQSNKDIAILEDPLYKRRWIPPDYDKEFREALAWWVREMAEWELEQAGQPLHIREWSRRLMLHERIRAALEVYTGTPNYDPADVIENIIQSEAVPNRPEHYLKPSGLRKLSRKEQEFKGSDFSKTTVWKVRGKLNIPRERYIAYTDFEPGWYGWAGWDAEQRAEALVRLIEEANRQGLSVLHQQCGLRASLRDMLSQLEHIPQSEQQEFKDIAYMCGIQEPCFCQAFRETEVSQRPPGLGNSV